MIEMDGPYPLSLLEWWDRQIQIGLGAYCAALHAAHRSWQELWGLR